MVLSVPRTIHHAGLALAIGAGVFSLEPDADADELPEPSGTSSADQRLIIGPSIAYFSGDHVGKVLGGSVDLTYSFPVAPQRSRHGLLPDPLTMAWVSAGARYASGEHSVWVPYAEVGTWMLITIGAGYSAFFGNDSLPRHGYHLFLGLPVPIGTGPWRFGLIEPYYRPTWQIDGDGLAFHELGLLVKLGFGPSE